MTNNLTLYFKLSGNNFCMKFEYNLCNKLNSELISEEYLKTLEEGNKGKILVSTKQLGGGVLIYFLTEWHDSIYDLEFKALILLLESSWVRQLLLRASVFPI